MTEIRRVRWIRSNGVLGGYSDQLAEKGFSVARTELAPGRSLDVYNLHADAGDGAGDLAARRRGFEQLRAFVCRHSRGRAVIVGGDFNALWSSPSDRKALQGLLASTGLTDAYQRMGGAVDHLDRVLYRDGGGIGLELVSCGADERFRDRAGVALSDHPAIHARFRWRLTSDRSGAPAEEPSPQLVLAGSSKAPARVLGDHH
jgi:endonuclease/exonuclease/phosphatase (EEP) superfamily protein YafD